MNERNHVLYFPDMTTAGMVAHGEICVLGDSVHGTRSCVPIAGREDEFSAWQETEKGRTMDAYFHLNVLEPRAEWLALQPEPQRSVAIGNLWNAFATGWRAGEWETVASRFSGDEEAPTCACKRRAWDSDQAYYGHSTERCWRLVDGPDGGEAYEVTVFEMAGARRCSDTSHAHRTNRNAGISDCTLIHDDEPMRDDGSAHAVDGAPCPCNPTEERSDNGGVVVVHRDLSEKGNLQ